jgi:hypothetical protein
MVSPTLRNRRQRRNRVDRQTRFMAIRRSSKNHPPDDVADDPGSVVRVKRGVMSTAFDASTGHNTVLVAGSLFPSTHALVKSHAWAFEPADDSPVSAATVAASRNGVVSFAATPPNGGTVDAIRRLEEVQAEIAALSKPLPTPRAAVDVSRLADELGHRDHRRRALEMTLPVLQREVLIGQIASAEAVAEVEQDALQDTAALFAETEGKFLMIRGEFEQVQHAHIAAQQRATSTAVRVQDSIRALEEHDQRHGFVDADMSGGDEVPAGSWSADGIASPGNRLT